MALTPSNHPRSARRRELRRAMPSLRDRWTQWLLRRQVLWSLLYIACLAGLGGVLTLTAHWRGMRYVGQTMIEPVYSRVEFEAVNEERTEEARSNAGQKEPAVFQANKEFFDRVREKLLNLGSRSATLESIDQIEEKTRTAWEITPEVVKALKKHVSDPTATPWRQLVDGFLVDVASIPLLRAIDYERETDLAQLAYQIVIRRPDGAADYRLDPSLLNFDTDRDKFRAQVMNSLVATRFPKEIRGTVLAVLMEDLAPTYFLDTQATSDRRQASEARVAPIVERLMANQLLIGVGRTLKPFDVKLLEAERQAYVRAIGPVRQRLVTLGHVGLMVLLTAGLWVYVWHYKPRVAFNGMRGLALTLLMGLMLSLAVFGTLGAPKYAHCLAVFPTLIVALVLTIAYDQRFALAVAAAHAVMVVVCLGLPVSFGLVLATGLTAAVAQLNEIRTRSKLMWVGLWTGVAMAAVVWLTGLATRPMHLSANLDQLQSIAWDGLKVLLSGIGTCVVVQGALPAIEKTFKVTTSMTLKELNDASHPLLRRLAQEAPGTYQHSLRLADLAEAAASAVGADALLCKVGAMYHDIGKVNKPLYFVENQSDGHNRHEKLSPAMSLLIIVGHVKDGVEMARDYGLPTSIRHFIESHHGTTLVEFFYQAAKQRSGRENTAAPTEFEFRYPGPKPQTREAAILMLGDAIESASRAISDPTPIRLEQLVHAIAQKRLMDGQFDHCNLTLADLHRIEESMAKMLQAIYHARMKYPGEERQVPGPSLNQPLAPAADVSAQSRTG
ncbi:MAG: HDIG domain-containing protein [Phycisphaeraceae bacterium]|nr:HDIG domain-containing protein [Phycisphaeraceae bacterium]